MSLLLTDDDAALIREALMAMANHALCGAERRYKISLLLRKLQPPVPYFAQPGYTPTGE